MTTAFAITTREQLIHTLHEAAELEHNLMCTYLYAAFSLKDEADEGLNAEETAAVKRWRSVIRSVAIEEMGHLVAVWNLTSAIGGSPRFGRGNFPIDPGYLPAGVVVKLAPFSTDVLQHFILLARQFWVVIFYFALVRELYSSATLSHRQYVERTMAQATGTLAWLNDFLSETPTDIDTVRAYATVLANAISTVATELNAKLIRTPGPIDKDDEQTIAQLDKMNRELERLLEIERRLQDQQR